MDDPRETLRAKIESDDTICHMTEEERVVWAEIVHAADPPWQDLPIVRGQRCSVCHLEVRGARGGEVCANGHGGAGEDGIPDRPEIDEVLDSVELPEPFDPARAFVDDYQIAKGDCESGWWPSDDQEDALDTLISAFALPGTYTLAGAAGSGKTSLLKALLRRLTSDWDVVLLAPTWRAANRLREVVGQRTMSIHRAIYGAPVQKRQCPCGEWSEKMVKPEDLEFEVDEHGALTVAGPGAASPRVKLPRYRCEHCEAVYEDATRFPQRLDFDLKDAGGEAPREHRLVVVDEAGMVNHSVREDIERAFGDERTRVLGVGDPNQLPPVREAGADPDKVGFDLPHPTAALHRVHRQAAGDPILALAHTLKVTPEMSTVRWPFPFSLPGIRVESRVPLEAPARWAAAMRQSGADCALIALSNKTRAELNYQIRHYTGAAAAGAVIPGDRMLARGNSKGTGVYNGEIFTVCSFRPITGALLNEEGRMPRRRPYYEHDRILAGGVGVFAAEITRGAEWIPVLLVTPTAGGTPVLESDIIRGGISPDQARQRMREVARAWQEEYTSGISDHEAEFTDRRGRAERKRIAEARWLAARDRRELKGSLALMHRQEEQGLLRHDLDLRIQRGDFDAGGRVDALSGFRSVYDVALDCADVQQFCERVYGAVDPSRVCVLDRGECLTCYAMQGDQAEHVGVVFDSAFWGAWKHDRRGALQFAYTAVTRATRDLALFSIARS